MVSLKTIKMRGRVLPIEEKEDDPVVFAYLQRVSNLGIDVPDDILDRLEVERNKHVFIRDKNGLTNYNGTTYAIYEEAVFGNVLANRISGKLYIDGQKWIVAFRFVNGQVTSPARLIWKHPN